MPLSYTQVNNLPVQRHRSAADNLELKTRGLWLSAAPQCWAAWQLAKRLNSLLDVESFLGFVGWAVPTAQV